MQVDFGRTAPDYATHRVGFPQMFFDRMDAFGVGRAGQHLLDLGTGAGTLARGFALRGCKVTGLDPSEELLEQAQSLDDQAGVYVCYVIGKAEETGLAKGSFDVVTAGQCWHWFDGPKTAREAMRLLRPGGWIVIAHYDWLPLPGNMVEATEQLILAHNPAWKLAGGTGMYPQWVTVLELAGFTGLESFSFDCPAQYSHEAWRGRIRASAGVAASLEPEAVQRFDAELAEMLAARFPKDPMAVPHRVFAAIGRRGA